jgi:hypothetical protein
VTAIGRHTVRLLGAVAVVGLATAGCSAAVTGRAFPAGGGATAAAAPDAGAGESPAAAAQPDACALLTVDEAKELTRTELGPGSGAGVENGAATLCQFVAPPTGPVAQVEVFVGDGAEKILDIDRRLEHVITPLPGTGDEAYEEDGQVFLRKGTVWASVRLVRLNDPAENREPLRKAATLMAGRMSD